MKNDEKAIKEAIDNMASKYPNIPKEEISKDAQEVFNIGDRVIDKLVNLQMESLMEEDKKGYSNFIQTQAILDIGQRFLQGNIGMVIDTNPEVDIDKIEKAINKNMKQFFNGIKEKRGN